MIFQLAVLAFAIVGAGWFAFLVGKHGWGWLRSKLHARALAAEAMLKAKAIEAAGPLETRVLAIEGQVKTLAEQELTRLKGDVEKLKTKAGL